MHKGFVAVSLLSLVAVSACKKHDDAPTVDNAAQPAASAPATPAPTVAAAPPGPPPSADAGTGPADADAQAKLAYAEMEDRYINDAHGQWAASAKASSSFGDADKLPPDSNEPNTPVHAAGAPDGNTWLNNRQDMGFDWIEAKFAKPVNATTVRVAFEKGVKTAHQIDLIDTTGASHTVWTGLSDVQDETRGPRSWFVRSFDTTPYKVAAVKVTVANAVQPGYKAIDAIQLVGQ
ncbi:hypothetical protein [Cognatilysobacter terrigena]|uniref:hypothetical protein n=1 Tax=Cognatilysobacter terrigena TaxID=2488749 RepID=UPI001061007B|nr:hypothetical protein [Lysobacter terrigena]